VIRATNHPLRGHPSPSGAPPGGVEIDAGILARAFDIGADQILGLLEEKAITSRLDRGVDEDVGTWRLVFFHRNARLTVIMDKAGVVLRQSLVDFGDMPLPRSMHRP